MPRPARRALPRTERTAAVAVYFPSCLSRTLGPLPGEPADLTVAEALVAISRRAGQPVWIPERVAGHCCGVPFSSKGYERAHHDMAARTLGRLFEWSDAGRLPIVVDTSPCAYGLKHCGSGLDEQDRARLERLTILDSIEFAAAALLPHLRIYRRLPAAILHTVCSAEKMGLDAELRRLAEACSEEVFVPPSSGCCGFAGDRGWLVPELTASATAIQAAEVRLHAPGTCYSSSRTCEIGMARATGRIYRSYLHMLEWASRPSDEG
jgi:D-lactate dehydrogenase